ncbi:MAG: chemotaxis protein CheW [Rhodospirillales bacterium]|nr:chemotaxis protein CheW [Rhodospirillales bacterium]MCW8862518.1 chemotaxis protein CheW [Rhodospirillales bacterium]MCW8953139.1 chemotaxis protein CheW [Rhodospirillales bacterium]MCW8970124.1 chemotaxis protein CheW [Rhodospirillales bacterium]MCW9002361.1 chemotaxis protein CheW [Rhodospirillales bacterium]
MPSTELVPQGADAHAPRPRQVDGRTEHGQMYVTIFLDRHMFGLPIESVREIIYPSRIHSVPLSFPQVAGLVNIRGRIIPVIDLHSYLGITEHSGGDGKSLGIVIERGEFMDCLLVDAIGDIMTFPRHTAQGVPKTVSPLWRKMCSSVHQVGDRLLLVLDPDVLLDGLRSDAGEKLLLAG